MLALALERALQTHALANLAIPGLWVLTREKQNAGKREEI